MGYETIASPWDGLHKPWILRGIAENLAQTHYRVIKPVVKVDKCMGLPETVAKLIPGDDLARLLQKHGQDLERLFRELKAKPLFAKLGGLQIELEHPKMDNSR